MNGQEYTSLFYLDPTITFLNFGSFGACPKPVFEQYQQWQLLLEKEPVQFIAVNGPAYLQTAREALATYVHADANDLVFVTNPSYAVNIVAKSLQLKPGDEILTTNIEYGACDKTWEYYCDKAGAKYIKQHISLPLISEEAFVEEFFKGLTPNTRLIFISHITSATALILPIKRVCKKAKELGIPVFVDGAHAPAQVNLNIKELDPEFYTGACHKWMMAPKGASFLYAKKNAQQALDPLVISWGFNRQTWHEQSFIDFHQMQGTRDFSAFLTVTAAIDFMKANHWNEVSAACKKMVLEEAPRFCSLLNTTPLAPLNTDYIGQMLSLQINSTQPEALQRALFLEHRIEIPVMRLGDKVYIRFSINAFNSREDLNRLYAALEVIKKKGELLQ
jgi:isopenicillin-N epimerase